MANKAVVSVVSVLLLIVAYGVINLFIVGGQKLMDRDENKRIEILKTEIEQSDKRIKSLENELTLLEDELADIKSNADSETDEDAYNELADSYNGSLDIYNSKYDLYEAEIADYNTKVDEANELSEKIGGTWYILPIPIGKR